MIQSNNNQGPEIKIRADRPKGSSFSGFVVRSAQGGDFSAETKAAMQDAAARGLAKFGRNSLRPNAGPNPYLVKKPRVNTTTLEMKRKLFR